MNKLPFITFEGNAMTKEKKAELMKELTLTASRVTGKPEDAFIVIFKELDAENVAFGGQMLSEKLKQAGH